MKAWSWIKPLLIVGLSIGAIVGVVKAVGLVKDGVNNSQINQSITQMHQMATSETKAPTFTIADEPVPLAHPEYQDAFDALVEINKDAVGRIVIENTDVDEPVVQGDDNVYYLTHSFANDESARGAVFMDADGSANDVHIMLFGQGAIDGVLGELQAYEDAAYYEDHVYIELNIEGKPTRWKIFSVALTSDEHTARSAVQMKGASAYETGVSVSEDDDLLTVTSLLDTAGDKRLQLHAKNVNW